MRYLRTLTAAGLLGLVAADDALIARTAPPVPVLGPLDWLAHLATTGIAVLAVGPGDLSRNARTLGIVAVASVAIDVDHVPHYLGLVDQGRPVTHSLLTPAVLVAAGLADRRHRTELLAAAAGVGLHLVRDVATGIGVRLLAPFADDPTRVAWTTYATALGVLVVCVAARETVAADERMLS